MSGAQKDFDWLVILDNGVSIGGFKSEKDAQRFLLMNGDRHRDIRPDDDLAFIITF